MSSESQAAHDAAEDPERTLAEQPAASEAQPATEVHERSSFSSDDGDAVAPPATEASTAGALFAAAPEPEPERTPDAAPVSEPAPAVPPGRISAHSPGTAPAGGTSTQSLTDRPEVLAGAAFAGGLLVAMILKRLGR